MTAKEYLNQARTLDMQINAKQAELYKLKLMATSISSPQISDKVQSGNENNAMRIVDKIADMQNEINNEIDKLVDLKSEIHNKIQMLKNPLERTVLTERYLNCKEWTSISEAMNYTERQVHNIHGNALENFSKFH